MKIQSYLAFNGNCNEALNFYKDIFDGDIKNKTTYEGKDIDIPESYRSKIQHAVLKGKGFNFMAYDASPDTPLTQGSNMSMSIQSDSKEQATTFFEKLSRGGKIHTPFQETSWNALYGRCTDQFGIQWMINYDL